MGGNCNDPEDRGNTFRFGGVSKRALCDLKEPPAKLPRYQDDRDAAQGDRDEAQDDAGQELANEEYGISNHYHPGPRFPALNIPDDSGAPGIANTEFVPGNVANDCGSDDPPTEVEEGQPARRTRGKTKK